MSITKDLKQFWNEHAEWSQATFGTDAERGPIGPAKHLQKEVNEVLEHLEGETKPDNGALLEEYADCLFLLFDSVRRAGFDLNQLTGMAFWKLEKNKTRIWKRNADPNVPIEHTRGVND